MQLKNREDIVMTAGMRFAGLLMLTAAVSATLLLWNVPAQASSTVVEGPGFKVEQKDGLFGSSKTTYSDALGNQFEQKKGIFGGVKNNATVLGRTIQKNNQVNVLGPGGKPIITQKKTLFGGQQTHVDLNPMIDGVMDLLNGLAP